MEWDADEVTELCSCGIYYAGARTWPQLIRCQCALTQGFGLSLISEKGFGIVEMDFGEIIR